MPILACIDTNVLISMFISASESSPVVKVFEEVVKGRIIPIISDEIFLEYSEVSARPKFHIPEEARQKVLTMIRQKALVVNPQKTYTQMMKEKLGGSFDPGDVPFYAVVMEKREDGAYLITGNIKRFPSEPYIVTPREIIEILNL